MADNGGGGKPQKSVLTGYVFVINFMMGAGVLALPSAFASGGWGISIIMTVVVNLIALMTFFWLAEVQARSAILRSALKNDYVVGLNGPSDASITAVTEKSLLNRDSAEDSGIVFAACATPMPETLVRGPMAIEGEEDEPAPFPAEWMELQEEDLMEVGDMCRVWFGNKGKTFWSTAVLLFQMTVLWVYVVGWSSSVLVILPIPGLTSRLECNSNSGALSPDCLDGIHIIYLALFIIMMPLVCKNWSWMHYVQKFLIVLCYVATILMIVTSMIGIFTKPYEKKYTVGYVAPTDAPSPIPVTHAPVPVTKPPPAAEMAAATVAAAASVTAGPEFSDSLSSAGMGSSESVSSSGGSDSSSGDDAPVVAAKKSPYFQAIPFATNSRGFAQVFGILILVDIGQQGCALMMRQMPLDKVKKTFTLAFITITLWLILLGLSVALYMGEDVNSIVTLNFAGYDKWGLSGSGGVFIGTLIAIYPVCSTSAAYMLNVINMAESIESIMPPTFKQRMSQRFTKRDYVEGSGMVFPFQLPLRFGIMIISIILGFASYQFSKPLAVAGLFGFVIFLFVPTALEIQSIRTLKRLGLPTKTQYDTPFVSHQYTAGGIAFLAVCLFVYYITSQLIPTLTEK